MQTVKQLISDMPAEEKEQAKFALRILWMTGFWDHITRMLKENLLENWDMKEDELQDLIRRFGADEKVYRTLKYLGEEYEAEHKAQQE